MARDIEREQENGKRILLGGYTSHGSISAKNSLGSPRSLWRVYGTHACIRSRRAHRQIYTRTLLFREIATRPRRFKRLPNEVWLRKHGTYKRVCEGAYTARRSGNASFDYPEGYETNQADEYARIFRCISHGWDAAGRVPPAGEVFLCAFGTIGSPRTRIYCTLNMYLSTVAPWLKKRNRGSESFFSRKQDQYSRNKSIYQNRYIEILIKNYYIRYDAC